MEWKRKVFKKGIVGSVLVLLLSVIIPSSVVLAETIDSEEIVSTGESLLENSVEDSTDVSPTEVIDERTETEVVLDNHDGTFTKQVFQEPINIENEETRELERIDTELLHSGKVAEPKNTEMSSQFMLQMKDGFYQEIGEGNTSIRFTLQGATESLVETIEDIDETITSIDFPQDSPSEKESDLKACDDPDPDQPQYGETPIIKVNDQKAEIQDNVVLYRDVLPDVDFRQTMFNRSVKEDLILKSPRKLQTVYFKLETSLFPKVEKTGEVTFRDEKNSVVFEIPRPIMSDSKIDDRMGVGAINENLSYEILELVKNKYQLVLRVDDEWLINKERQYPIYLDPSITYRNLQNANARQSAPTTNYSGASLWRPSLSAHTLWVGKFGENPLNEAFLKTDMSKLNQASIQKATFNVYNQWHAYDNLSNELSLSAITKNWDPKTLTWNSKPTYTAITKTNVKRAQWATFDVTTLVNDWSSGKRQNFGIALTTKPQEDHWKQVVAAENDQNVPYFEITYAYNKPAKPTVKAFSNNDQKTGYLEVSWPKIDGATGYQVLLSSGRGDVSFSVGDVNTFTTKGKGIFPTDKELEDMVSQFHTDGKGTELAIDPRVFYENAAKYAGTNGLRGVTGYDIKVVAIYPGGKSPVSDFVRSYLPLSPPQAPKAKAYSNISSEKSGYVTLNWNETPLADSYKVLIFNGKEYQEFDVGNTLSWTSQGKGIWPTKEEVANGKYTLHADASGTELASDPRPVYKNAGTQYAERTNYWFRIKSYRKDNKHAMSAQSAQATPTIPQNNSEQLGMTDFWPTIPVRGGEVNATNGNLIFSEKDFSIEGRGPALSLNRYYNSLNQEIGIFGKGWSSSFEDALSVNTTKKEITWFEEDRKANIFKENGSKYDAPPGLFSEIIKQTDGSYQKVEEDKSITCYTKTGKLWKENDKNNNTLTYGFDSADRITSATDASGRVIKINYQGNGLVSEIILPGEKKISFKYDDKQRLIESRTARGKTYRYAYSDKDELIKLFEPKHTAETPFETQFIYQTGRLEEIVDPIGKKTQLTYDVEKRVTTLTNERGKKTEYHYSIAGNPLKTIEDSEGLKLTTTFEFSANKLIKETNPKGQAETYKYDADGNVVSFTDEYGTEKYEYNNNNDVISATDTENRETTVAYEGADALSETQDVAATSSFVKYDTFGNPVKSTQDLGTGENLVLNSGFETGNTDKWYLSQDKALAQGGMSVDANVRAPGSLSGKYSVKITSSPAVGNTTTRSSTSVAQRFDVEPNTTYTLSADVKAANMKESQTFMDVWLIKEDNKTGVGWRNNRSTAVRGNSDWVRRQVTFTTTSDTSRIGIYLKNEQHAGKKGSGTVWYDNVQLEKGETHTGYNPVQNSGLEAAHGVHDIDNFIVSSGHPDENSITDESFTGNFGFRIKRSKITDSNRYISQYVTLNQQEASPITISAMSKSENVKASDGSSSHKDYSIWADVIYQDGTISYASEPFPTGTHDWNRAAFTVRPTKPIKEVKLLFMFRREITGTTHFDNLRIIEGSKLTETTYDPQGNYPVAQYDELRRKTTFSYDSQGNKLSETDEKGNKKVFKYNDDNQLLSTILANGTEVRYTYDDNGNIMKRDIISNGITQSHAYQYDADDKTVFYQDPLNRQLQYSYDASGNETGITMPNGAQIQNEYDSADRQIKVLWGTQPAFSFQYDPNGNQTKVTDHLNNVVTDKVYDDANRITKVMERGGTIQYAYKDKPTKENKGKTDKVTEITTILGTYSRKISFDYNALDENVTVYDGDKTYRFDHDEFGNKTLYTTGNGVVANFNYDQTKKLKDLVVAYSGKPEILRERYAYDAASNRTSIVEGTGKQTTYKYDAIHQLTEEVLPTGEKRRYQYDGFGNRTNVSIGEKVIQASFNSGNQLVTYDGATLTYDQNGNRLTDGKYIYTWDSGDRLTSVTKKGNTAPFASYQYDDDGRRIKKSVDGVVTNYHYDGDSIDVLYETDETGKVLRHYIYSDDNIRLAMKSGSQTLYYHYNGHGDVIALTDNNREVVATYNYDAWGNVLSSTAKTEIAKSNPFGYAGYMYDTETELYYLMARYYNPTQGVFLSLDPDPGDDDDPLTMNGYAYADNNPVMNVDPDGHWVWTAVGAGFAAYDAYKTYKKTKSWKKAGWAAAKSIATSVAFGAVFKGIGAIRGVSKFRWTNITKTSSRFKNLGVNRTRNQFGKMLTKSGYSKTSKWVAPRKVIKSGPLKGRAFHRPKKIQIYSKGSRSYTYRGKRTYDYRPFKKARQIKIRTRWY